MLAALENFIPPYEATVIAALHRLGLPVGKTNLDEFAAGFYKLLPLFITRNPWDRERVPGPADSRRWR